MVRTDVGVMALLLFYRMRQAQIYRKDVLVLLFSFVTGNNDMHLKNFSLYRPKNAYQLTPAYDLLNVAIANPKDGEELALSLTSSLPRAPFRVCEAVVCIAFTAYGSDDTTDGDLLHVSAGRTYASQGNDLAGKRQPQMNSCLVIVVKVLIDTVLLDHEHLAAYPQEFVEFVSRELRE